MSVKMLIFDYKPAEHSFFEKNKFENFDITFFEESLNEVTVEHLPEDLLEDASIISVFITSRVDEKVISKFKNLMIISTRSTGFDHISIPECCNRRIKVLNVENYGNRAVVQYTFTLILALVRRLLFSIKDTKELNIQYYNYIGRDLNELTLGVAGTGAIGAEVCKIAHAFGMKILAYDIRQNQEIIDKYGVRYIEKDNLIRNSDIITLHMPLNEHTENFITKKEFSIMKSSALLINTSRGPLVNTQDLYNAILNKTIAGGALDVIECEEIAFASNNILDKVKKSTSECITNVLLSQKLVQLDNVIVTPHVAYSTQDSIDRILKVTFESIKDCMQGGHANQVN